MEKLSIHDNAGPGPPQQRHGSAAAAAPPPAVPQQLPPQMFTTAASLLDLTDKKLLTTLRDGRKIIGILRSWDQFGNLVLQDSYERIFVTHEDLPKVYADVPQGVFVVRGENTMLMGEIDLDRDGDEFVPEPWQRGDLAEVRALKKREDEERKRDLSKGLRGLKRLGFEGERSGEAVL
ncbi:MAG: hypothetical protein Q9162_004251 [Coniocarpon cinnabarinum]